ncbi:MAG: hypothetical protein U9R16_04030 [Campylobacterota bacterium]|nr:hypothetical protein [Campylobacterota bacterium]
MKRLTTSLLLLSSIVLFSGCEKNLDIAEKPKIDLNMPVVDFTSVKSISGIDSIALEWKSISTAGIDGYHIYRSNMQLDGTKFKRVATLDNKYITHYLDTDLDANSKYSYTISLVNSQGIESAPSEAIIISTLPTFDSVSLIQSISNLPRQIKILWRPHSNPAVSKYIIERTSPTTSQWKKLAVVKKRFNIEYIDEDLGDNETYTYRIKSITFDGIESNKSELTTATTKALPNQINGLSATRDLPRSIQLSWGESSTKDVVHYNIYSATRVNSRFTNIAQAPVAHNRYDNKIAQDGKIFFYKITTVDKDGLESNIEEVEPVIGSTLSKPKIPRVTLAQIQGNRIILNWEKSDNRAVSYNIYKSEKHGWSTTDEKVIPNIEALRFEDTDVVRGIEYKYRIQAVDKYGLLSKKTDKLSSMLPKLVNQIDE